MYGVDGIFITLCSLCLIGVAIFIESFRTEARWQKAVQHLREKEELENQPRDIGKLMKEINLDIIEEESENIKEQLYKLYIKDITRKATAGFAEWYKKQLLENAFVGKGD